ncbi:MAG: glycosyltransferase family 2 protein [Bacteroidetes bacterium]|nr:glycosyltransferase family 2 protein [Bacteroidota bacterium]
MPAISVITVCFNNLTELQKTIASVDAQTESPFEHIIINGSTQKEIENFLAANTQPSYRKVINEPDKGISDAFNKGIAKANGEIIHLLNSGDYYADTDVLKHISDCFLSHPKIQWLHGKYLQYRGGDWAPSGKPFEVEKLYRGIRQTAHPTMFVRKELYAKYGNFNLNKKIAMDYDFLLRIREEPFYFTPKILVKFSPDGVSNQNIKAGLDEVAESYKSAFGFSLQQQLWFLRIRLLDALMKTSLGSVVRRILLPPTP